MTRDEFITAVHKIWAMEATSRDVERIIAAFDTLEQRVRELEPDARRYQKLMKLNYWGAAITGALDRP